MVERQTSRRLKDSCERRRACLSEGLCGSAIRRLTKNSRRRRRLYCKRRWGTNKNSGDSDNLTPALLVVLKLSVVASVIHVKNFLQFSAVGIGASRFSYAKPWVGLSPALHYRQRVYALCVYLFLLPVSELCSTNGYDRNCKFISATVRQRQLMNITSGARAKQPVSPNIIVSFTLSIPR